MNKDFIILYILTGICIAAIVESGYDKRRNGDISFQFDGPDLNWIARIMTIALWPIVIIIAIALSVREIVTKINKDNNGD